jgi:hypothetical protein
LLCLGDDGDGTIHHNITHIDLDSQPATVLRHGATINGTWVQNQVLLPEDHRNTVHCDFCRWLLQGNQALLLVRSATRHHISRTAATNHRTFPRAPTGEGKFRVGVLPFTKLVESVHTVFTVILAGSTPRVNPGLILTARLDDTCDQWINNNPVKVKVTAN